MFPPALLLLSSLLVVSPSLLRAQSPQSDPQAVAVLQHALAVSGASLNPVRSFVASGTITYFWAGQKVVGPATIRARGHDQFRIDADMPDGRRSLAMRREGGSRKGADGKLDEIPSHNTLSGVLVLTLPYPAIAAALSDTAARIEYVERADVGGQPAHRVRVTTEFSKEDDPEGLLAKLSRTDYLVDAGTGLIIRTEDAAHPVDNMLEEYSREVEMERYTAMSGIAVPVIVREKIAGQITWEFQLTSISFNGSLSDSEFLVQ
jgi:hypothetical protein